MNHGPASVNTFPISFNVLIEKAFLIFFFFVSGADPFLYQAIPTSSKYIPIAASTREGGRK